MTDIVVRRGSVHGMPMESYADVLRERLPDHDVAVPRTREAELAALADATVITGGGFDAGHLEYAGNLEYFACSSAGYEHLPLQDLAEAGVTVTNAAGVHGPNVAETVIGGLLTFERGLLEARRRQTRREWRSFETHELAGSRVVVVGMGAIGTAVVERLAGFDVETVGVRHSPEKGGPTDEVYGYEDVEEAVVDADALVLCCPLTAETRGLVDRELFATLPPDVTLVNVARGPVVDTEALVEAIRRNIVRGALLDVTDPEPLPSDHDLWGFENVLITPHNAGHTPAYYERLVDIVARNVERAESTGSWDDFENQIIP